MRTLIRATFAMALLVLLQGCDSLLEEPEPSTAISQEVALSTPGAVQGIRASMYDWMHTNELSTDWLLGPSALADNTWFRSNQGRHQELNRNLIEAGVGTAAWDELYALINDANILINAIEEGVLSEAETNKMRAEGLFMRALAMHHGTRIFGYDPDGSGGVVSPNSGPGAGFNLGIVIQTEPTLSIGDVVPKARSTVTEVYDQIESDLEEALSLFQGLPEDVREGSPFSATEVSTQALMARVNLYERDWQAAFTRAQNAIDLAAERFGSRLADPSELMDIFDETAGGNPEAIFTIDTDPVTETPNGVNDLISAYTSLQWLAQLPTQDLISLYEEGDARLNAWYEPCFDEISGNPPSGCELINDAGLELHKYASEQGVSNYGDDYVHLRIAEMVLIQAEALLNTSGVAPAIERLNDLRAERGASALDPGSFDFESAYDEILAERRRELVAEGHRFFDLKRLGRDIDKPLRFSDPIPFSDFRILDDLPESQVELSPELEQNPGYAE